MNLSFAFNTPNGILERALAFAGERGTLIISAAGNSANDMRQYPGAYSFPGLSSSVAAVDARGNVPVWATRGEQVDVVAPGESIQSTWLTYPNSVGSSLRNFAVTSGSSFSAPYVTGIAGLAKGLAPDLKENDFQEILRRTARDLGEPGEDDVYGAGLVDAAAIVEGLVAPRGIRHGRKAAQGWRSLGNDTLTIERSGINRGGQGIDGKYYAEVWEVFAEVRNIENLAEPPQGWVRYTGEGGWSRGPVHEFNYSGGFVRPGSEDLSGFELVSTVYFIREPPDKCLGCPPVGWVPRSPEEVVFEWTAWASFQYPPSLSVLSPEGGTSWAPGSQQVIRWDASDIQGVDKVQFHFVGPQTTEPVLLGEVDAPADSVVLEVPCETLQGESLLLVTAINVLGLTTTVQVPVETEASSCAGGLFPLCHLELEPGERLGELSLSHSLGER